MEIKIELWLRGREFQTETMHVPEHLYHPELTNDDGFEENVRYREALIKLEVDRLKHLYSKQIDKQDSRYQVYIVMPSKMDLVGIEEDARLMD